jgi:hypothetical protein
MKDIKTQDLNAPPSSAGDHIRLYSDTNATTSVSLSESNGNADKPQRNVTNDTKNSLKSFVIAFMVLTTVSTIIALYFTPSNSFDTSSISASEKEKKESSPEDNYAIGSSSLPKLINVPVAEAKVGEKYNFTMRISDTDTDIQKINVSIVKSPEWLNIEGFTLSGYPVKDTGVPEEVVLSIFDGENTVEEKYYIFVYDSTVVTPGDEIVYELHD